MRAEKSPVASRSAVSIARDTGLRTVRTSMVAASQASPMSRTAITPATTMPCVTPPVIAIPAAMAAAAVSIMAASSNTRRDASRSSIGFQPVAHTPQRRDTQGVAEFPPQADDVDVDGLLAHEAGSPNLVEKLVPGVGAARAGQ